MNFNNWTGTAATNTLLSLACSSAVGCSNITFSGFNLSVPAGQTPRFVCQNVQNLAGLNHSCTASGT
ncbi:hypothetical protein C8J57DRAFT_230972 [Mycena rebaudengoi]|nr:hypothetical protein C8J57DRAFT_230972 [Mycena rebaudengoi]